MDDPSGINDDWALERAARNAAAPRPATVAPEPVTVAVVDDDEWRRRGLVDGIRELGGGLNVVAAGPRDSSTELPAVAAGVVVVAADPAVASWDRYVGVRTAGEVRHRLGSAPTVIVLTDDLRNPLLPVRAAEAGADHLYPRSEVSDLVSLQAMLVLPSPERRPAALVDLALIRTLGVSFTSRLSAGLVLIEQAGLTGLFDDPPSLRPTRRRSITLRRTLASTMRVRAAGPVTSASNQPTRPTWHQLRQLVDLARGAAVLHL